MKKLNHNQRMQLYRQSSHEIAVDFDGTICTFKYPHMGRPIPGAREFLHDLHERGLKIVIWSSRMSGAFRSPEERTEMAREMTNWLRRNAMPFDEIDMGNTGKRLALAYVDDRGVAAGMDTPWEHVLARIDVIQDREIRRWKD